MTKRAVQGSRLIAGPLTRSWLESIGVRKLDDVRRMGPVEIFRILRLAGKPASLNLVYALEGELLGVAWNKLPANVKAELRAAVREIRNQ